MLLSGSMFGQSYLLSYQGKLVNTYKANYREFQVYICAGQSNMVGPGNDAGMTAGNLARWGSVVQKKSAYMFLQDKPVLHEMDYRYYTVSCCPSGYNLNNFSIEIPLATYFTDVYNPVVFVKFAKNGTRLYNDGTTNWNVNAVHQYYDTLKQTIKAWKDYATLNGYRYTFKGFIWLQGEGDAQFLNMALAYQQNQTDLIDSVRAYVGRSDLPVYLQEIYPSEVYAGTVNAAKRAVAAAKVNVFVIPWQGVQFKADSVHMSGNGVFMLGDSIWYHINTLKYK